MGGKRNLAISFLVLAVVIGGLIIYDRQEPAPDEEPVAEMILEPEHWQDEHPAIYASYMRNSNEADDQIEFGGDQQIDYIEKYPDIKVLYEGFGFSKEYFSARGHLHTLEDVLAIERPKPGASCLACKTAAYEGMYEEYGEELFAMDFDEMGAEAEHPITCYSCHRNDPGEIHVTVPHAEEGFKKLDFEIAEGNRNCAQCHVNYYFEPETKAIVLPWEEGLTLEDIEKYSDEREIADWEHPRTGTPLLKIQHPEYEMYRNSTHDQLGMDCASCHMPTVEDEEGEEYVSHWWTSPLKTTEESCLGCHGGEHSAESLEEWVNELQQEVEDKQLEASSLLVELVEELATKIENEQLDEETIEEVRSIHRRSQLRWDFIFAENSTGSHNFDLAHKHLDEAIELAKEGLEIMKGN
ncbi:ammonia-forming cytochrome c nitrite reductase subunit c552 [Natroniella sp. ANB-PHB2]|uniref:ammonia-forming cytochrome c nitrite reductase subunit c552 n=1 Tax=Natroniella sp. ANB-PHB2 TaxID=3384444 RepID=UPI0038D4D9AA